MSLLGNDILILPITTCATWYACKSHNKFLASLQGTRV